MSVQPLPYHRALVEYFRQFEPELWEWFASDQSRSKAFDTVRLDLLKSTYRLPEAENQRLYDVAREAASRLDMETPITLYQAVDFGSLNAGMARLPGEAHIVFSGPVQEKLSDDELTALLGHELSHLRLWTEWEQQYWIVEQILASICQDDNDAGMYFATERLLQRHNEIFCDRGAMLAVGGDLQTAVSTLIKMDTSIDSIRPASFLEQVEEIFQGEQSSAPELTHPEAFIRARALQLFSEAADDPSATEDIDEQVTAMLQGRVELEQLDLVGRQRLQTLTRRLIDQLLGPAWMRTRANLNHARLFFSDYQPDNADEAEPRQSPLDLDRHHSSVLDYFCFVMLDFATADRGLEEAPLAQVIDVARRWRLLDTLEPLARKELRLRKKQFNQLVENAEEVIRRSAEALPADEQTDAEEVGES